MKSHGTDLLGMFGSACNMSAKPRRANLGGYVYKGPTFQQLRRQHDYLPLPGSYELQCPLTFQTWTIGLLVVGGMLFVVAMGLLLNLFITRARRRSAALRVAQVFGLKVYQFNLLKFAGLGPACLLPVRFMCFVWSRKARASRW